MIKKRCDFFLQGGDGVRNGHVTGVQTGFFFFFKKEAAYDGA